MKKAKKPRNRAQCKKCKAVIESLHVHDFKTCDCGSIHVDGGPEYNRRLWPDGRKEDWIREMP